MASEQVTRSPPAQWSGLSNPAAGKLFLFFIFPFFFFVFSFPFRRSPLFASFSFSLCRFPFVVRIAFVASIFASLLSLVADSVCLSQCYAPPPARCLRTCKSVYSLVCRSCAHVFHFVYFLLFSSSPVLVLFRTSLFHPVCFWWALCFLLGFSCDSFTI